MKNDIKEIAINVPRVENGHRICKWEGWTGCKIGDCKTCINYKQEWKDRAERTASGIK